MFLSRLAVIFILPIVALGMRKRAIPSDFALFGYGPGPGLGGLPLFYADGYAYIGDASQSNSSDAANVAFTRGTDNVWIGSPNKTSMADPSAADWSNVTFYVPDNTTSDKRVGFLASDASTDGAIETGFFFYGSTAVLIGETGTLESSFNALQVSDRVWRLYWNDTSSGQIPIVLRNAAPSNPHNRQ
ncbi:hypothetical protein E8E13_009198 [Curvularia kusanoi]|uniref:Uncharacterized protein n=1 Tax=Curvularia kusanoi TaxID=90978 RepID=A0A9P4TNM5_CURKU|nr:hypothetical protein E8E13_009198 [Curvularia kusanoi]